MKIAISTDGEYVSAHFGRCPTFTLVEIENDRIVAKEIVDNPGHQPGYIPRFLHELGVRCIIAGGMGPRASEIFRDLDMEAIVGVTGKVDDVVDKLIHSNLTGGASLCQPGAGKGYGMDKLLCDHPHEEKCEHE
ncbi:MAG: dinitrogenase iron-molybdenum cofactor [Deltaproteobacteria bacterium]|nr:dinitrogenase iron-molybdenum cofactor [Deltaproteobacteria bacterium]